jgi:hypothetical protein
MFYSGMLLPVAVGKILIALALTSLGAACQVSPGGGGSEQVAPDVVKAGGPAVVQLTLSVWGAGGAIRGRYTDISLHYRLVGEGDSKILRPKLISQEEKREVYEFTIPAYPEETIGEIEYYLELNLDGHHSRINGMKRIKVV